MILVRYVSHFQQHIRQNSMNPLNFVKLNRHYPEQISQLFDKPQYLEVVEADNDEIVRKLEKHFSSSAQ